MKPALQIRVNQQLSLTPQLQQAIRLLQLSSLELELELNTAVESNPLLEVSDGDADADGDDGDELDARAESEPPLDRAIEAETADYRNDDYASGASTDSGNDAGSDTAGNDHDEMPLDLAFDRNDLKCAA